MRQPITVDVVKIKDERVTVSVNHNEHYLNRQPRLLANTESAVNKFLAAKNAGNPKGEVLPTKMMGLTDTPMHAHPLPVIARGNKPPSKSNKLNSDLPTNELTLPGRRVKAETMTNLPPSGKLTFSRPSPVSENDMLFDLAGPAEQLPQGRKNVMTELESTARPTPQGPTRQSPPAKQSPQIRRDFPREKLTNPA